jgi:glyoxylase-like metal-dependent hydrolase (beta-lactamase superfamily II)
VEFAGVPELLSEDYFSEGVLFLGQLYLNPKGNAMAQGNALDQHQHPPVATTDVTGVDELTSTLQNNLNITDTKHGQIESAEDEAIKKKLALVQQTIDGFYFRQLLPGRDICLSPKDKAETMIFTSAEQLQNLVYLIGDAKTRECVVVDACWDVKGIRAIVAKDNMKLVGAIVTHYHFDHVGGTPPPPFDSLGITVPGVYELAMEDKVQVYINKEDADHVKRKNKIPDGSMVLVEDSTVLNVGSIELHFIHTPGHTAGSQCIYIPRGDEGVLLAGDTLFAGSCGRLDFPDCDPKAMFHSLQKKLATLPESTKVYSGHNYGDPCTSIAAEKKRGQLKPVNESHWLKYHHEF